MGGVADVQIQSTSSSKLIQISHTRKVSAPTVTNISSGTDQSNVDLHDAPLIKFIVPTSEALGMLFMCDMRLLRWMTGTGAVVSRIEIRYRYLFLDNIQQMRKIDTVSGCLADLIETLPKPMESSILSKYQGVNSSIGNELLCE